MEGRGSPTQEPTLSAPPANNAVFKQHIIINICIDVQQLNNSKPSNYTYSAGAKIKTHALLILKDAIVV